MKKLKKSHPNFTALISSIVIFMLFLALAIAVVQTQIKVIKDEELLSVTKRHFGVVEDINNFVNQNVSLLSGFSAYIQMNEEYPDEEVYRLLNILLEDQLESLRNVAILQDTIIVWVYPLEENKKAIGVDLAETPSQADAIEHVKKNLETVLVGPIELVQGGVGFIVRVPILKEDEFWGMASIVLKAEYAFSFIEEHSKINGLKYFITHHNDKKRIIYGDASILDEAPLVFKSDSTIIDWDMYVIPENGWENQNQWLDFLFGFLVLIGMYVSRKMYCWVLKYTKVLDDKVQLELKSFRDGFTGIYNRGYFDSKVKEELVKSDSENNKISLIYFDIDHFKKVNDNFGHAFGDDVLSAVVKVVEGIIRSGDLFARWGGDEFIILLPSTDLKSAGVVAEKVRLTINNMKLRNDIDVTISMGISERKLDEEWDSWFSRTDKALYKSKKGGRNKITMSDDNL